MRGHSLGSSVREKIMRPLFKAILFAAVVLFAALLLKPGASVAGDIILSHNTGGENAVFFIENEPSLVINGFDLTPYTAQFPVGLDAVSISVSRAAPTTNIELVVYQDANGGSPVDATLIHRQPVTINRSGFHRFQLSEAAIVTEPVVWVGFYLPVGFRFHADVSGPSVLTYWAWTPGAAFDISSLASAPVLGPGDGTDPVSIDMQGIARITAEMRPLFHQEMESDTLLGHQLVAEGEQDTSAMGTYPHCGGLLHDPEDISVTSSSSFTIHCELKSEFEAPIEVVNPDGRLLDLQRAGHLYKLEAQIPQAQLVHGAVNTLPVPVTHCMSIQPGDLEQAVIAEGRGIPERWHVLPSVRFGEMVCAEITTASYLSYFLPRGAGAPPNVNLALGWTTVNPHPIECGLPAYVSAPVVNTGQSWFSTVSGNVKFIIENIHVRSGTITGAVEISVETSQLGPGMRHLVHFAPIYVTTYVNELHRLQVRADFDNQIQETNEDDNVWFTEYILSNAQQSDRCFDAPWLTATPTAPYLVEGFCFVDEPREVSDGKIAIRYSDACQIDEFKEQGHVQDPITWEHTMRGCRIRVRTEVVGQELRVRWSSSSPGRTEVADITITQTPGTQVPATRVWNCAAGGFEQYRETVKVRGESVRQLVIDHDRPPPTPTTTPKNLNLAKPQLTFEYKPETKMLEFSWSSVLGADTYDFRFNLAEEAAKDIWLTPPVTPDHANEELTFHVTATKSASDASFAVERGKDYVWKVRALDTNSDDGPWAQANFNVRALPTPRLQAVENIAFDADNADSGEFRFVWRGVEENETPVGEYEFRHRERGTSDWTPRVVTATSVNIDVGVGNKAKPYEWQVRAKNGGPWAKGNFNFSTSDLTRTAAARIRQTATLIPTPRAMSMMADRTDPSKIVFTWGRIEAGVTGYNLEYRLFGQDPDWSLLPTPASIPQPVNGTPSYELSPITVSNRNEIYEWRVRAVVGRAVGDWGPERTAAP